jgi:NADH:ubiquinone oxidoreductase subunit 4 (subunit M)
MFFVIGIWGSGYERIRAAYYFFFFTSVGSLFFLLAILVVYSHTGSTSFYVVLNTDFLD